VQWLWLIEKKNQACGKSPGNTWEKDDKRLWRSQEKGGWVFFHGRRELGRGAEVLASFLGSGTAWGGKPNRGEGFFEKPSRDSRANCLGAEEEAGLLCFVGRRFKEFVGEEGQ